MSTKRQDSKRSITLMKKDILILFLILVIALLLRLHDFKQGEVFVSSDEVYAFEIAAKPIYGVLSGDILELATQLFRYFNYPWGWTSLIGTTIVTFILVLFHIPITEFTINLAGIFIGLLSISSLYILCIIVTEKRLIAFFSALILAILPVHVSLSRSVTVNNMYSTTLFFLTLCFFISYFKKSEEEREQSKKDLAFGMITLGFYLGADNQFPGILPVLFFSGILFYNQKTMFQRIVGVVRSFFNKYLLLFFCVNLPLILGAIYLAQKGMFNSSYLNLFHSKPLIWSLYYNDFFRALYDDAGPVLVVIFVISFIYNFCCILWKKEQRRARLFVFIWFGITAFPWLFLLSPEIAWFQLYIIQPLSCLVILSAFFFHDVLEGIGAIRKRWLRTTTMTISVFIIFCVLLFTFASTSNLVYKTNYFGWQFTPIFGQVGDNNGIKTIGYYVREHLPADSIIFADVESFNAHYYFNRTVLADLDLSSEQIYRQLFSHLYPDLNSSESNDRFDYAFIQKKHVSILAPLLEQNGYHIIAIAVNNNEQEIAYLYADSRELRNSNTSLILHIKEYDKLFNDRYGTLDALYIDYG